MPPVIDYSKIFNRIKIYLDGEITISEIEFEDRANCIIEQLFKDPRTSNILNGIHIPFMIPKLIFEDIGKEIEKYYLSALESSYRNVFPEYEFKNHCKESIAGKISILSHSRHEKLLESMQKDTVVGYYFPCLSDYSIPASVEQLESLPDIFLLAGGFDTCAAIIGSPTLLFNERGYAPLLWLSALKDERTNLGYHIESYGYNLTFNQRFHYGNTAEYWTNSLVVLG